MTHTRISTKDRESLDEQINHERASFEIAAAERDRLREVNRELVAALEMAYDTLNGRGILKEGHIDAVSDQCQAALAKAKKTTP